MTNHEIARVFERIAMMLELTDANPFRIRAYERAAIMIQNLQQGLKSVYEEGGVKALEALPGIGEDLAAKIEEMATTDTLAYLALLEKKIPKGVLEMMEVEGLGPKKTKKLWKTLKIQTIADLSKAAKSGAIAKLPGFGEKTAANILRGIEQRKIMRGRMLLVEADRLAAEIVNALEQSGACGKIIVAGSVRRRKETVRDLDFLATSANPDKLMDAFCNLSMVASVTAKGDTKSTVFLKAGLDADLRVVEEDVFGAALQYFTGNKDHNVHIRRLGIAKGFTISEYGVFKGTAAKKGKLIAAKTEEEVYKAIGLPLISPVLREDSGEIEAAIDGRLPSLIDTGDIRGDLHVHSVFSDGLDTIESMARKAKELGYAYIAITDHASPMGMVQGVKNTKASLRKYMTEIENARKKVSGIMILAGAEVDILKDGSLYLSDDILHELDWVIAAIHQYFHESREANTKRFIQACKNPFVHAIGHPTTRILGRRLPIEFDLDAVLQTAKENDVCMEHNASPTRLDLPDTALRRAKDIGVKIAIGSDAHSVEEFDLSYCIAQAQRGWLEKEDIVNAHGIEEFWKR